MNILINTSNLKAGGGIQVADSVCRQLGNFHNHSFVVVLSSYLKGTEKAIKDYPNVTVVFYDIPHSLSLLLTGRDKKLDSFVDSYKIKKVLTIFGPSIWIPKVPHLSGFASGQLTPQDSPFYSLKLSLRFRIHEWLRNAILKTYYNKCSNYLWVENESVSAVLRKMFPNKKVFTVTNYYNQIFDNRELWEKHPLPTFDGITLLTVANIYPHKNLCIALDVAKIIEERYPDLNFRFVMTVKEEDFLEALEHFHSSLFPNKKLKEIYSQYHNHFLFIGSVNINECPSLYEQCDIEFQPTLLECFTATYPEAMRMSKPIVTTDLAFAHGLCGEAALYYSALSAEDASEKIYMVSTDLYLRRKLVEEGKKQLLKYDNYEERTNKLIKIVENME